MIKFFDYLFFLYFIYLLLGFYLYYFFAVKFMIVVHGLSSLNERDKDILESHAFLLCEE